MIKRVLSRLYHFGQVVLYGTPRHARFEDAQRSIDIVAQSPRSLIRVGDGEFIIMNHGNIAYQQADPQLAEEMRRILDEYSDTDSPYWLAMPREAFTCSWPFFVRHWKYMKYWLRARPEFMRRYDRDVTYLDAFIFAMEYKELYPAIWKTPQVRSLILVHNDPRYAETLRETSGKPVEFVGIPPRNAYSEIDRLVSEIESLHADGKLVLVSAGPCGKALVYRLCRRGIRCIDTGHCFDDPLWLVANRDAAEKGRQERP